MIEAIKENLKELRRFKSDLTLENVEEFKGLVAYISLDLPEDYASKFRLLDFYEIYDDQVENDDLPF